LTRLAAVLTGFLNELLESLPVSALPAIPAYRWSDLWSRAMLASARPPAPPSGLKVRGTLTLLGADLHEHGSFASCAVYALLEGDAPARLVRLTASTWKVNVVSGRDLWACFPAGADELLRGLSAHQSYTVEGMTLLPGGALLWDGKAKAGRLSDWLDR